MSRVDYSKAKDWIVRVEGFDEKTLGKTEAIMCLGNGYMGQRSTTEERYLNETRDLFVAGTFNKFDENEVTELPNAADILAMDIQINGESFNLVKGEVKEYYKELNIKTGELTRFVNWVSPKGDEVIIEFKRIISKKRLHTEAVRVNFKALDKDLKIRLVTGIDGRMSNNGSQHFNEGDKRLFDNTFMQYTQTTTESKIDFVFTTGVKFLDKNEETVNIEERILMDRRQIYCIYEFEVKANEELTLEKISDIRTSRDLETEELDLIQLREKGLSECKDAYNAGYLKLAAESAEEWNTEVWEKIRININSEDEIDNLALHFAQYHLHIIAPKHDARMNIGAKGLSGEGYKGHTFWDTELFMLPYFTYSDPEIARKLVKYRYLTLKGAHDKAASNNYEGAQFPWESAWLDDGEVTPVWGAADIFTGKPTKIWSGFIEQHITGDVAYGIWQYYTVTGDQKFMDDYGYELMLDTARFWITRIEAGDDGLYHINDVVGPDEYKEHVNDNAFTNYMAVWNVKKAIEYTDMLKEEKLEIYDRLNNKLDLERFYELWTEKVDKIYLPVPREEDKLIAQDSTYLTLKDIDLSKYKNQEHVGLMFQDYNLEQVNEIQVSKQADIMILFLLMEDLFPLDVKQANWDYYEARTLHDSSLSLSTHCVLANDMNNKDMAYDIFERARAIDLGENMKSSDAGIHAASLGGIWQSTVYGFGGVRMLNGELRIEPALPEAWKELEFVINWKGQRLSVYESHDVLRVVNETATAPVTFKHHDQVITLDKETEIKLG